MGSKESLGQSHPKSSNLRKEDPREQRGSERTSFQKTSSAAEGSSSQKPRRIPGVWSGGNSWTPPRTISCLGKQQGQEYVTHGEKIKWIRLGPHGGRGTPDLLMSPQPQTAGCDCTGKAFGRLILLGLLKIPESRAGGRLVGQWAGGLGGHEGCGKGVEEQAGSHQLRTLQKSNQRSQKGIKQRGGPLAGDLGQI